MSERVCQFWSPHFKKAPICLLTEDSPWYIAALYYPVVDPSEVLELLFPGP